jgi:hypothetical protein
LVEDLTGEPGDGPPPIPRVEVLAPRLAVVRFAPREFAQFRADRDGWDWLDHEGKIYGYGNCELEFHVALPEFIRDAIPTKMMLLAELATRDDGDPAADSSTASAPRRGNIAVRLLDQTLCEIDAPDDPADSRGVLSHHARFHHGSYGYLLRRMFDLTDYPELREQLHARRQFPLTFCTQGEATGLSLYGRRLGRYIIDPTLIIQTAEVMREPVGWMSAQRVTVDRLLDRARVVDGVTNSDDGGHAWRYTTTTPPADWNSVNFDDSAWPEKQFRTPQTRGPVAMPSPEIWLRTTITIEGRPLGMVFRYDHDEPVDIYLNGQPLVRSGPDTPAASECGQREGTTRRTRYALRRDELEQVRRGKNVIAVRAHQTRGGPGIDMSLRWIELIQNTDANDAWPPVAVDGSSKQ